MVLPDECLEEADQHILLDLPLELCIRGHRPESIILDCPTINPNSSARSRQRPDRNRCTLGAEFTIPHRYVLQILIRIQLVHIEHELPNPRP